MKAQFKPDRLSPSARLSYRLFERQVEQARVALRWQMHRHPATNNGSPADSIPVFLLNDHSVDSADDARAYIARLRDVERALRETSTAIEDRARMGIFAPKFSFKPVRDVARKVIDGEPFGPGRDTDVF